MPVAGASGGSCGGWRRATVDAVALSVVPRKRRMFIVAVVPVSSVGASRLRYNSASVPEDPPSVCMPSAWWSVVLGGRFRDGDLKGERDPRCRRPVCHVSRRPPG